MDLAVVLKYICALLGLIGIYIYGVDSRSIVHQENKINCSSANTTINQLKEASFGIVSCSENDDREFWEAACKCAIHDLPESQCPRCRTIRAAENASVTTQNRSSTMSADSHSNHAPTGAGTVGNKSATSDVQRAELKMQTSTYHVSPSPTASNINFIRFGK